MIILLFLALNLSTSLSPHLLRDASELAADFQKKCEQILPSSPQHHDSLASLVCGEKITDQELKENLSKTSLIHIFIVSGSHLILFDELLSILRIPFFLRFLFLLFYSLAVGWQAPAVRALFGMSLRKLFRHRAWHLPADLHVLATGLALLFFFPAWWSSLSLQMSWCAALALSSVSVFRLHHGLARTVLAQLAIYFLMAAPLWGLGSLHPLSIVFNLFLAPLVAYVLLPSALLAVVIPPSVFIFEALMSLFREMLPWMAEPIALVKKAPPPPLFLWMWIFTAHTALHILRLRLWQGRDSQ